MAMIEASLCAKVYVVHARNGCKDLATLRPPKQIGAVASAERRETLQPANAERKKLRGKLAPRPSAVWAVLWRLSTASGGRESRERLPIGIGRGTDDEFRAVV